MKNNDEWLERHASVINVSVILGTQASYGSQDYSTAAEFPVRTTIVIHYIELLMTAAACYQIQQPFHEVPAKIECHCI